MDIDKKIIPLNKVKELRKKLEGKKIITTNGTFDLLHIGHLKLLNESKKLGDILWVGINSDNSVRLLKGDSRPYNDQLTRARQLASLMCVDYVTIF